MDEFQEDLGPKKGWGGCLLFVFSLLLSFFLILSSPCKERLLTFEFLFALE